jgi:hypothetical protein
MAKIVTLVDDYSSKPGTDENPVNEAKFSLNGDRYTMDLSAESLEKLTKALAPFIAKATLLAPVGQSADSENTKIREWAKAHGHTVNDKGRIPDNIVAAYKNATGSN